jgi:superfamily II DNA or RNA helicase
MATSRPRPPVVRSVRTPEAVAALRTKLDEFAPSARQRGRDLFQAGAVLSVRSAADHYFNAEVKDESVLGLTFFYTRGAWTCRCSCPVGENCKHAYATGLAWIADVEGGARDGRDPGEAAATSLAAALPATDAASVQARALEAELSGWLRALPSPEEAAAARPDPLAGLAGLRIRLEITGRWFLETRAAPGKPWKAPAQKWMVALATLRPADFQSLPPAEAALGAALSAEFRITGTNTLGSRIPLAAAVVEGVLRTTAARPALAMPDGSPLVIEPLPLVPEALESPTDSAQLTLRLVAPDGRVAETAKLVALRPEPLYLFDNRVWRGPPPGPSAKLPVAALSDSRLLPRLRAAGLRLPKGLASQVRLISLRPQLKCWLAPAPDGLERDFHLQLSARSGEPACAQHWTGGAAGWAWAKNAAPPPRLPGEPALEFDLADARAVSARLGSFRLTWDGWAESWTRPVTDNFPDEFLAWHANLPPALDVDLSPELASLLGAPLEAELDLSVDAAPGANHDWFDLTVGLRIADTTLSADEVALLLKSRGKWVHLPRHGWRKVAAAVATNADSAAALDRLGLGVDDVLAGGRPAKHRLHVLQLALEAEALAARDTLLVQALQDRAARIAALPPATLPADLKATLRPYQLEGFQFLAHLSAQGFGGVLADDMGLGKTVQTLAWLLDLAAQPRAKGAAAFRALVVCPKSVTHGWLVEAARFAPTLAIRAYSPDTGAGPLPVAGSTTRPDSASAALPPGILVANYTQLRLNAAQFRAEQWDAVILDEGQFIKNPGSQVAVTARSLRTRHRLVLTGTPIENRLADLWSLFAFAQPGLLGDQPGFRRQYHEADPAALARLHRRVRHFLLRRTKAQAAPDLPPRTEDEIIVELEGGQRTLYDAELKRARAQLLGVETKSALDAVRFHVLASLLRLRQICCHPALIDPDHADMPSAKLDALMEMVEELAEEGHQVLVFSQFVEMLKIIRERLVAAGIGHLMLTGATENRAELVDTFQTDPTKTVFLLSLKAAGFGLNLTAASYAILYDPWWNPAAEAQAIDRIHRIGQTKPVIAYRLLAEGTVEEKIRLLQREKSALANAVIQEESLAAVMDLDSLKRILA